jgi:hypothetical protein
MNYGSLKERLYEEAPNAMNFKKNIIHLFSLMVYGSLKFRKLAL